MPVMLIHGDNDLEIDDALRAARAPFSSADVVTFDGPTLSLGEMSAACLTSGLFDPSRLVIVHGLHERLKGRKGGPEGEEIAAILAAVPDSTTLLLVDRGMGADHALVAMTRAAGGTVTAYATPRRGDLPRWVVARGKARGVTVERGAADLLAELVGANPLLLDSELTKLGTYADGRPVTPADVQTLVGAVPQDSIFALVDAVAAGNRADGFRLLRQALDASTTDPMGFALYLIRMLTRQARILLRLRLALDAGTPGRKAVADLKLPSYYADRYIRQAQRLPRERLIDLFERLAALETALKSGKAEPETGLDLLVAELCR